MWNINTIWFEMFIFSTVLLFGNILMNHFEERTPGWRRIIKTIIILTVMLFISFLFGKVTALIIFGLLLIPVLYVHVVLLPKKGINGWTGEPKEKYYEFRGWDKDIFRKKSSDHKSGQK